MSGLPSDVGARAEAAVAMALARAGARVYFPLFCAHAPVNLVVEDEGGLAPVQCKTARLIEGVLSFRTCSNTGNAPKDYRGQVDFFGVYSPDLDQVFLVPTEHVPRRTGHLRVGAPRNGQARGLRWARDHVVRPSSVPQSPVRPLETEGPGGHSQLP